MEMSYEAVMASFTVTKVTLYYGCFHQPLISGVVVLLTDCWSLV